MNKIRKEAFNRFKQNKMAALAVSILCTLITCAGVLLSFYLSSLLWYLFFFLVALPVFFMGHASFISMLLGRPLTFKNAFLYYRRYYSLTFFGSYKIIKSCLKTILVILAITILGSIIYFGIMNRINPYIMEDLTNTIETLQEISYEDGLTLNELFEMNGGVLGQYALFIGFPSSIIGAIYLFHCLSINSLNIYLRMSFPLWNRNVISLVERNFYAQNKWTLKKEVFLLNWPKYLIMLVFGIGGIALSFIFNITKEFMNISNFGILLLAFSMIFFLPLYFFEMQCLFEKHEKEYKQCALLVGSDLVDRLKATRSMTEEQQNDADKLLNDLKDSIDENDQNDAPKDEE